MDCRDRERLFALVRCAVGNGSVPPGMFLQMTESDWERLFGLCVSQGLMAVTWPVVHSLTERPHRKLLIRWALGSEAVAQRHEAQKAVVGRLKDAYAAEGVRMLLLKGLGLGMYYPDPAARECGDVDIWLYGDYERGNRIAVGMGARGDHLTGKHAVLRLDGVLVENHFSFLNPNPAANRKLEDILKKEALRAECRSGWTVPSPDFNALFLVLHGAGHLVRGLALRNLLDWGLFLRSDGGRVEWSRTGDIMRRFGLDAAADVFTGLASELTGDDLSRYLLGERRKVLEEKVFERITAPRPEVPDGLRGLRFKLNRAYRSRWIFDDIVPGSFVSYLCRSAAAMLRKRS